MVPGSGAQYSPDGQEPPPSASHVPDATELPHPITATSTSTKARMHPSEFAQPAMKGQPMTTQAPRSVLMVATLAHVRELAPRMRRAEVLEVQAALALAPMPALLKLMEHSRFSRAVYLEGEFSTLFGVIESKDGIGFPWLLSNDVVDRKPLAFWQTSKQVLGQLRRIYPALFQYVDARYTQSISWARRLGFTVAPAEPHGAAGLPFHPLAIEGLVS
jgi:hypothetical protein